MRSDASEPRRPRSTIGTFTPLRHRAFRSVWGVHFACQLAAWAHMVAAQWVLVSTGASVSAVAGVTAATTLPSFLFGLVAGALADLVERRRLLLVIMPVLASTAGVTAILAAFDALSPSILLTVTFVLGAGAAFATPALSAAVPSIVEESALVPAMALVSMSANISRILGPLMAGVILALSDPAAVFALNATILAIGLLVATQWRLPVLAADDAGLLQALRTGVEFVWFSPEYRRILSCTLSWVVPASSVWALLPVVAHDHLKVGSNGYALLFGCMGAGAILAALRVTSLHRRLSSRVIFASCAALYAGASSALVLLPAPWIAGVAMLVAGATWMVALNCVTTASAAFLPPWVRGRGLAAWYMIFFGGQAAGAAVWGALADRTSPAVAIIAAAAVLAACGVVAAVRNLPPEVVRTIALPTESLAPDWSVPQNAQRGRVWVYVQYDVPSDGEFAFEALLPRLRRSRRRTGSRQWRVLTDPERPGVITERFMVQSWDERLRQLERRNNAGDRGLSDALVELTTSIEVRHLVESLER